MALIIIMGCCWLVAAAIPIIIIIKRDRKMDIRKQQHRKIMCKHISERRPDQYQSQAIRFSQTIPPGKADVKGFLGGYYQVQIDHSAN